MLMIKKYLKQKIFRVLSPYGFSVDGVKPAGYIGKQDKQYKAQGYKNLREYFCAQWNADVQSRCDHYVQSLLSHRLKGNEKLVEIGAGVGFITQSIFQQFPKAKLYSFEFDQFLAQYLNEEFKQFDFISMPSDGKSLKGIANRSTDCVLAFGVFTYINLSNIMQYIEEVTRVTKKGGIFFFDIFDTDVASNGLVESFEIHTSTLDNRPYISGNLLNKVLQKRGFVKVDSLQEQDVSYASHKFVYEKVED